MSRNSLRSHVTLVGPLDIMWVRRAPGPSTAFDNVTYIILAALAWWLIKGDIPAFCDKVARKAAYVYAAGVVCGEYLHKLNDWLASVSSGRCAWYQPFMKPAPTPLNARFLFGDQVIVLTDEALTAECLAFEAKPAKRRRTRKTKVATGG